MIDLTTLTDDEARDLLDAVYADVQRRTTLANAPARADRLAADVSAALGRTDGTLWADSPVTGAHDVWPTGMICQHPAGQYWRAGRLESFPPGTQGAPWTRVWPDGDGGWTETPPAGTPVEAWDRTKQYMRPAVVSHEGRVWDLTHTNSDPGWEPGVVPGVWTARP